MNQQSADNMYRKMTETPIPRLVITLGIPTTLSMLITNIYNMADTYFVGKLGTSASGAVGIVFGLMAIIQAFGFMCGHGAGSIISRRLGMKDSETASCYATTGFVYSLIIGGLITLVGFCFFEPILYLLGSTPTILPYAKQYAFYILLCAPVMTGSFVLNNILRYEGKASFAMIGLITGGILNIFGDWLLMRKFGMDIRGAGLSTAISQCISFLLLLSIFLFGKTECRLSLRRFSTHFTEIFAIVKTGFSSLLRQGLNSISTMFLNNLAGTFGGDSAVAALTIVNRICFLAFAIGLGIGQGFQPVASFNYGAGKYSRVRKSFTFTFIASEVLLGILSIIGMCLSPILVGFFRDDPEVIAIGTLALRIQLLALFFQPLTICANMMFQSIGKNVRASILSALRSGLIFIPAILILSALFQLNGVLATQTTSDLTACIISIPFVIHFIKTLPADQS